MELPGPRGWFPLVFLLLALVCFPIWVSFHSGTIGTLLSWLAGTERSLHGGAHFVWGIVVLGVVLALAFSGGYTALERVQLAIVILMLLCVAVSLMVVKTDCLVFLRGFVWPRSLVDVVWEDSVLEVVDRWSR